MASHTSTPIAETVPLPVPEENYGWQKKETGMESLPQNMTYPSLNEDSTFSVSDPIKGAHVTYTIKVAVAKGKHLTQLRRAKIQRVFLRDHDGTTTSMRCELLLSIVGPGCLFQQSLRKRRW